MAGNFYNRTRRSESLPLALLQRGQVLALPLYFILRASDLAREGMENSASYRFADHIYRGQPSGRGWLGRWLDASLLTLPASRSFRNRFFAARDELCQFLTERRSSTDAGASQLDVLSVPCGLPRELVGGARLFRARTGRSLDAVIFHGLDLDAEVLRRAEAFARCGGLPNFLAHHGDAFDPSAYPAGADFIASTGLAEFLTDEQLERLYGIFFGVLRPGGWLVTSGMRRVWLSDYLLRLVELHAHYRTAVQLEQLARCWPFSVVRTSIDEFGIQSILSARK